ncbi:MAG: hypothetical protein ACK5QX_07955 [bacterium]|jgi:hypothetical protein
MSELKPPPWTCGKPATLKQEIPPLTKQREQELLRWFFGRFEPRQR